MALLFASQSSNRIDSRCPARRQRRRQQRQRKHRNSRQRQHAGIEWAYLEQEAAHKARSRCCSSKADQDSKHSQFCSGVAGRVDRAKAG